MNPSNPLSGEDPVGARLEKAIENLSRLTAENTESNRRLADSNRELCDAISGKSHRERQRYVSVERAAELLGKTPRTVRKWLRKRDLLGTKPKDSDQAHWLVDMVSIERMMGRDAV
jgi:hypothetical protein